MFDSTLHYVRKIRVSFLVPSDISSVLEEFGSSGYRVLALAYKHLPKKINWKSLYHLKLEDVKHCLRHAFFQTRTQLITLLIVDNYKNIFDRFNVT